MYHRKYGLVAGILFLAVALTPGAIMAGPFEDGKDSALSGDYTTAFRLWQPLAEQGNAIAQSELGGMYANGLGVPQNYVQAAKWWRLAAEQGDVEARVDLAVMYDIGLGVPRDRVEAVRWYRLAAEQGYALGQQHLGIMLLYGLGAPRDYVQAHMWFNLAAAQGMDLAAQDRDMVAAVMTPAQTAEAQILARAWRPRGEQPE